MNDFDPDRPLPPHVQRARMSARRDAPLMPGDRVETADRRRGFAVAPAPEDRWRILFDDHTFDLVARRELRREIMAELEAIE